jgi:hypothetical protein
MYIQKVKSRKNLVGILKVKDENSRIRIHWSEARTRGSRSVPKCHGSWVKGRRLPGRREGSPCRPPGSGSIGQRHGSADPDPYQKCHGSTTLGKRKEDIRYLEGEQAAHADHPLLEGGAEHALGPHHPCRDVEEGANKSAPHPAQAQLVICYAVFVHRYRYRQWWARAMNPSLTLERWFCFEAIKVGLIVIGTFYFNGALIS